MINNLQVIMNQIVELLDNIKVEDNVKVQVLLGRPILRATSVKVAQRPFKPTSHGPSPWWPINFRNVRRVLLGATKRADTASKLWCLQTPHNVSEFIFRLVV